MSGLQNTGTGTTVLSLGSPKIAGTDQPYEWKRSLSSRFICSFTILYCCRRFAALLSDELNNRLNILLKVRVFSH